MELGRIKGHASPTGLMSLWTADRLYRQSLQCMHSVTKRGVHIASHEDAVSGSWICESYVVPVNNYVVSIGLIGRSTREGVVLMLLHT